MAFLRAISRVAFATLLAAGVSVNANAQQFPTRPITLIVGLAAGGGVDVVARIFADKVSKELGQPIVVENRGGGGGIPAAMALKNAAPDGYTLMVVLGALHTIMPAIQKLPFEPIDDFTLVTSLYSAPGYVIVPGNSPANSMQDLVALAKNKGDGLSYGSPSSGSPAHITGLLLQQATGARLQHIPYRGGGPMMADLLAGRIDLAVGTYTNFKSHLAAKNVKALAIASPNRWDGTPSVPTLSEQSIRGINVENTFAIAGPKGMPSSVVKILNDAFREASRDPDLIRKLGELGAIPTPSTPQQVVKSMQDEVAQYEPVIKKFGITAGQ